MMLKQIEGSHAVAEAVALARPEVICAYPITPQTHIVEELGALVKTEDLKGCEFINVESEFAALSVAMGASAAGARARAGFRALNVSARTDNPGKNLSLLRRPKGSPRRPESSGRCGRRSSRRR